MQKAKLKIGLFDVDAVKVFAAFPNLALMKLSAWHKAQGQHVEWYNHLAPESYSLIHASKVFSFSPDWRVTKRMDAGGVGFLDDRSKNLLLDEVEHSCPDYGLYKRTQYTDAPFSQGFLTRGCIRKCDFCRVWRTEGKIREHSPPKEFIRHKHVIFMDNNFLALPKFHKIIDDILACGHIKVDFNQGLDARLIDAHAAKQLARLQWWKPVRLACDSHAMKKPLAKAVGHLRNAGVTPSKYRVYVLIRHNDYQEAEERLRYVWDALKCDPMAQPFIPLDAPSGHKIPRIARAMARWVNRKAIFKSCPEFKNYDGGSHHAKEPQHRTGQLF